MDLARYIAWVGREIVKETPEGWVLKYRARWERVASSMLGADGLFEGVAFVVSRWEYLGGLYLGAAENDTGWQEAKAFTDGFLEPKNPNYKNVHNIIGRPANHALQGSDIFSMIRNRPMHAISPAAIVAPGAKVGTWLMGYTGQPATHLSIDGDICLTVWADLLLNELIQGMQEFADYLRTNQDMINGRSPQERFLRAEWAGYRPFGRGRLDWLNDGTQYGIPQ